MNWAGGWKAIDGFRLRQETSPGVRSAGYALISNSHVPQPQHVVVVHSMGRLARKLDDQRRIVQTLAKRGTAGPGSTASSVKTRAKQCQNAREITTSAGSKLGS